MPSIQESIQPNGLAHRSITPRFGLELEGVSLLEMSDDDIGALLQLAAERGVVVARNQVMSMQQQASFAHRLGPLTTYPAKGDGIPAELLVHRTGRVLVSYHESVYKRSAP